MLESAEYCFTTRVRGAAPKIRIRTGKVAYDAYANLARNWPSSLTLLLEQHADQSLQSSVEVEVRHSPSEASLPSARSDSTRTRHCHGSLFDLVVSMPGRHISLLDPLVRSVLKDYKATYGRGMMHQV